MPARALALCALAMAGFVHAQNVGFTVEESTPHWEAPARPKPGAPNVVVVLLDDVGFGQASAFGGPIATPTLDRLSRDGVRYNRFHTTALCSPTRAALLTGRNHHAVGFGSVAEMASGFPGYNAVLPASAATVAEVLRTHGYSTAAFGKWHLLPDYETSPAGPFDRWPTGKGFDYFYGFLGGETNQYHPAVYRNTLSVTPPERPDYHFMADMADDASQWLRSQRALAPDRPFFLYFATGGTHSPHQAPQRWIDKYRGRFDAGWDRMREEVFQRQRRLGIVPENARLSPRPEGIPAWESLSGDQQRLYARMMEVFAGYLEYTDSEVGRLLDTLDALKVRDNTLVVYVVGDNGASGEGGIAGSVNSSRLYNGIAENPQRNLAMIDELGGPATSQNYPAGWAWAGNTPFKLVKTVASHLGGTRNGLVVSWPGHIKSTGGVRTQFHHVVDIAPTIFEAAGIAPPAEVAGVKQMPIDGISMAYSFDDAAAPDRRTTQYFEMFGNRAIYQDGWMASAFHGIVPWSLRSPHAFAADRWELYDLNNDFAQARDLAAANPAKLRAMQDRFIVEAANNQVFPLGEASPARMDPTLRPSLMADREHIVFTSRVTRLPEGSAPDLKKYSHRIVLDVVIDKAGEQGVLLAQGGRFGGFSLYLLDGKPHYTYNYLGEEYSTVHSPHALAPGKHQLEVQIDYTGDEATSPARVRLRVGGQADVTGNIPRTMRGRFYLDETFDIGEDTGTPVAGQYRAPFRFAGEINSAALHLQR